MKTLADFRDILASCSFHDWVFVVGSDRGSTPPRPWLQLRFDADDGKGTTRAWSSRKWFLSPHMTDSEVVQMALKAVLTAVEHEAREVFCYRGRPIFGPHFDVEQLWELCTEDRMDRRS